MPQPTPCISSHDLSRYGGSWPLSSWVDWPYPLRKATLGVCQKQHVLSIILWQAPCSGIITPEDPSWLAHPWETEESHKHQPHTVSQVFEDSDQVTSKTFQLLLSFPMTRWHIVMLTTFFLRLPSLSSINLNSLKMPSLPWKRYSLCGLTSSGHREAMIHTYLCTFAHGKWTGRKNPTCG